MDILYIELTQFISRMDIGWMDTYFFFILQFWRGLLVKAERQSGDVKALSASPAQ